MDVIETAKRGTKENSVLGFVDSVNKQVAINKLDKSKTNLEDGVYTVNELLYDYSVTDNSYYGVKPVITVPKSKIK